MIWNFMVTGGWCMAPIVLCSVIAFALLMERSFFWAVIRFNRDEPLRKNLLALTGDLDRAQRSADPLCQVLATVQRNPDDPTRAISLADRIVGETKSTLPIINMIAAVSTSLGLFGTVLGVAMAFDTLSLNAQQSQLAQALSVALNTTVLGLIVYLPAFAGSSMSHMLSSRLAMELEQSITSMTLTLREQQTSASA